MDSITLKWKSAMAFDANIDGTELVIASPDSVDKGLRPKPLMLVALAGCTGLDVASLVAKMRVELTDLQIDTSAEKSETIPTVYTSFALTYRFYGTDVSTEKLIKIVTMSQQRYCGVSEMLHRVAPLSYRILLNDQQIYSA